MTTLVSCEIEDGVAVVTMDDGKANVLSFAMFDELGGALSRAEVDSATVVLAGRPGRFSGGFDLAVLTSYGPDAPRLLRTGFELAHRLLSFPLPVVVACTGHAYAMGAFLVLSGDYRIAAAGDHSITANEVVIGMTLPRAAIEICRQRLTRAHFERATILAEVFGPEAAVEAGWIDAVVPPAEVVDAARRKAVELAGLDPKAHRETKLRARAPMLTALRNAIDEDDAEFLAVLDSLGMPVGPAA